MWNLFARRGNDVARRLSVVLVLAALLGLRPVAAAEATATPEILEAIVAIEARIPADARTADTLGQERGGSGVVIDSEGLVLTIGYLVLEAESVIVRTASGRRVPASVVAYHGDTGFGLLRASADLEVRPMRLGTADRLKSRDRVLVASFGGTKGVLPAIVAERRLFAGAWEYLLEDAIFTAPPHPLAAGAALIGPDGHLLGIGYLTLGSVLTADVQVPGNMFVPVDALKPVMADLVADGRVSGAARPWLGLYAEEAKGRVFVERVAEGGPADKAGIRAGDIVLKVGDEPVAGMADLYRKVWAIGEAGVEVPLTILQEADPQVVRVISGARHQWFRHARSF